MLRTAIVLAIATLTGCFLDGKEPGPLDGEWRGLADDGTEIQLSIDQNSNDARLNGMGIVTWKSAEGERTDPLFVDGEGSTQFMITIERNVSFSYDKAPKPVYFSGNLTTSGDAAWGMLSGDDGYGFAFRSVQLLLAR
jgi:hypothetical protein